MSAIDLLYAAHPFPPPDVAVGRSPIDYLRRLPNSAVHLASVAGYRTGARLTRSELRAICLDPAATPMAKYACIMAWGGQNFRNFDLSVGAPGLEPLVLALLASANNRQTDFVNTQVASAAIPGLGISFYTKLLFFLRPIQDAFILDQWTAKSILLLQFPPVIGLEQPGFARADPATRPAEYERFCQAVEALRGLLWPVGPPPTGEQVEMAMFDRSRPDGFWRGFVKINFEHPKAGELLADGGESLTQAQDYRCGLLVIRRIDPPRLFVIGIHGSCCHWSSDDCYRLLLARLRELLAQHKLPITLVLPPGPCPQWFTDALQALGITVECSNWSDASASADADTDDDDESGAIRPACSSDVDSQSPEPIEETRSTELPSSRKPAPSNESQVGRPLVQLEEGPKAFIKVVDACGGGNDGMICLHKKTYLWLKNQNASPRYLIGEILGAGGDFTAESNYTDAPGGVPNCGVGGSNYQGGVWFYSDVDAVRYLKRFFSVMACPGNRQFDQAWVDNC